MIFPPCKRVGHTKFDPISVLRGKHNKFWTHNFPIFIILKALPQNYNDRSLHVNIREGGYKTGGGGRQVKF